MSRQHESVKAGPMFRRPKTILPLLRQKTCATERMLHVDSERHLTSEFQTINRERATLMKDPNVLLKVFLTAIATVIVCSHTMPAAAQNAAAPATTADNQGPHPLPPY